MKVMVPLARKTIGSIIEEVLKKPIVDLVKVSESSHNLVIYNQIWKVVFEDGSIKYIETQIDFEKYQIIISL